MPAALHPVDAGGGCGVSCTLAAALPAAGAGDVHGDSNHQDLCHQHKGAGTGSIVLDGKVRSAVPNAGVVGHSMP
jgi:hypothetical protein